MLRRNDWALARMNLIATGVTLALISRDHSLRDLFHAAEALQKD
jgi:hypothetical protein